MRGTEGACSSGRDPMKVLAPLLHFRGAGPIRLAPAAPPVSSRGRSLRRACSALQGDEQQGDPRGGGSPQWGGPGRPPPSPFCFFFVSLLRLPPAPLPPLHPPHTTPLSYRHALHRFSPA